MAAVVSVLGVSATFAGGRWRSADPVVERLLGNATEPTRGDDPYPDRTAAEAARARFKAKILHVDDAPPLEPGAIA